MSTDTTERIDIDRGVSLEDEILEYEEVDDQANERFTHIVNPPNNVHIWREGMSSQDVVDIARSNGWPVKALCGKIWIPKYNPDKYPACPECIDIAHKLMSEMG